MDKVTRREFGEYIHEMKRINNMKGADNFPMKDLDKIAREFLGL
jgi:hypothetical protein